MAMIDEQQDITIKGARSHNLQDVSLKIPRNKFVVITGVSGSGKSSLAFDTLYAEGQRRYVESLSAYARQFLQLMPKPEVEQITGLSPAIAIDQKTTSRNPRSTVGTITEIYDYLRLLFARVGTPYSPTTGKPIIAQSISDMVDRTLALPPKQKYYLLAPVIRGRKGEYRADFANWRKLGYERFIVDGTLYRYDDLPELNAKIKHDIHVVIDRLITKTKQDSDTTRLAQGFENALELSDGLALLQSADLQQDKILFSARYSCPDSDFILEELEPRIFSFNSPHGACNTCNGLGSLITMDEELVIPDRSKSLAGGAIEPWSHKQENRVSDFFRELIISLAKYLKVSIHTPWCELPTQARDIILNGSNKEKIPLKYHGGRHMVNTNKPFEGVLKYLERQYRDKGNEDYQIYLREHICPQCHGHRLNSKSLAVKINEHHIGEVTALNIDKAYQWLKATKAKLSHKQLAIADKILQEVDDRLSFLIDVGLGYLTLARASGGLSGGEAQRIRLASQIGSKLCGVMYVLDEPSIGLHQRDNDKLISTLQAMRDLGNSVIVVEHDEDTMRACDHIIDMGKGAGVHGGNVIANGDYKSVVATKDSITANYLRGDLQIAVPKKRRKAKFNNTNKISIKGITTNNLKNLTVNIPLKVMTCITGVSGSGKSSLVMDTLYPAIEQQLGIGKKKRLSFKKLTGVGNIDKLIHIDQKPIGRTPRSNPATYIGVFSHIRDWYAKLPDSLSRGYKAGRFSFNVKGGRCEVCQGDGVTKIEMHFLPDVYVKCDACDGSRYNRETLEIMYNGKSIADVLDMSVEEACIFFRNIPTIYERLKVLEEVGLGYISLGQSANTLSGGEAQRIKLAKELARKATGKTLYILDEPSTGLHSHDVAVLLKALHSLVDKGNSMIIIEHNLDIIKTADHIIDIGAEGGEAGGNIVCSGTPEEVAQHQPSYTGQYLAKSLKL